MIKAFSEKDHVIIDLCGRKSMVVLKADQAEELAYALEARADEAELYFPKSLDTLQRWNINVQAFSGIVSFRIDQPGFGSPERVPIPVTAARNLAKLIRDELEVAQTGWRFSITGVR